MTAEQIRLNAEKSFALAKVLFPFEEWIPKEASSVSLQESGH
jgi:hypothetical protein